MSIAWAGLALFALVILGVAVVFVLLLAHPKTRKGAVLLLVFSIPLAVLMIPLTAIVLNSRAVKQFTAAPKIDAYGTPIPPSTVRKPPSRTVAVPTHGDVSSAAVPSKTAAMWQAMVRAVGRALADTKKHPAAEKETPQPLPSPVEKEAGAEGNADATRSALTLALSQKERGPNQRPAWVDAPPQVVGDSYQMSIVVGPYTTRGECEAKLPEALQEALGRYVEMAIGSEAVGMVQLPAAYMRQEVCRAEWEETRQYSVGPMIRLHYRLQFDRPFKARVQEAYRDAVIARRLRVVGGWAALGLSLLALCFGYLKTDLATGGAYRGRLRLAAVAGILALAVAAVAVIA